MCSRRHAWQVYSAGMRAAVRAIDPTKLDDQQWWRRLREDFHLWYQTYVHEQERKRERRAQLGTRWRSRNLGLPGEEKEP